MRMDAGRFGKATCAVVCCALLLSACASSSSTGSASKNLRIFATEPSSTLDPGQAVTQDSWRVMELIYDNLIDYNSKDQLVGDLASSWDVSSDGLTYTFHLRPAKFSDGSAITADDVVFSLQRMQSSKTLQAQFANVTNIAATNSNTVTVTLSTASRIFLDTLAQVGQAAILSKKSVQADPQYFSKPTATSGPWMLKEYIPKDHLTLVANPNYWQSGYPKIPTINYTFCADPTSCAAALESGTADMYYPIAGQDAKRLKDEGKIQAFGAPAPNIIIWQLLKTKPPFSDVRVRQALAYVMPRQDAVDTCWSGYDTVSYGEIIQQGSWAYTSGNNPYNLPTDQALAKAMSLLDAAGWKMGSGGVRVSQGVSGIPDGTKLAVTEIFSATYAQARCVSQLLQNDVAPAGFAITPQAVDSATYVGQLGKTSQMGMGDVGFGTVDELMYEDFDSTGTLNNYFCNLNDPNIDKAITDARATSSLDQAKSDYAQVQQILVNDVPCIITGHQIGVVGASLNLSGFYTRTDQSNRSLIYATMK